MPISDKTRKILWGRSANRCALCRRELVIDSTAAADESIVGDECHIVSGKEQGPRHDPAFPAERLDEAENLVLLCRVHHKMVDDQWETYTVDVLQKLNSNHEKWVSSALADDTQLPPVRIRRIKTNIPSLLIRLASGRDVMNIIGNSYAFSFDHDEPNSDAEVDLISSFLQEAQDWGDLSSDMEAGDRVKAAYRMSALLRELEEAEFRVFGGREVQRLEGGVGPPAAFPVAILKVVRVTNPEIVHLETSGEETLEQAQVAKKAPP
jgi:hypothetical protein